jgi:hypothetical protein
MLWPFLPGIDWIMEMDRTGLVVVPILMLVIAAALAVSVQYDLSRIALERAPVIVVSVALTLALAYALTCYVTAVFSRWRIRRDLRRVSLPNF